MLRIVAVFWNPRPRDYGDLFDRYIQESVEVTVGSYKIQDELILSHRIVLLMPKLWVGVEIFTWKMNVDLKRMNIFTESIDGGEEANQILAVGEIGLALVGLVLGSASDVVCLVGRGCCLGFEAVDFWSGSRGWCLRLKLVGLVVGGLGGTGTRGFAQENVCVFAIAAASVHLHKFPESPELGEARGVALLAEPCRRRRPLTVGALNNALHLQLQLQLRFGSQSIALFHEHLPQGRAKRFRILLVHKEEVSIEQWVHGADLAVIEGIVGGNWGGTIRIGAHKRKVSIIVIIFFFFTILHP